MLLQIFHTEDQFYHQSKIAEPHRASQNSRCYQYDRLYRHLLYKNSILNNIGNMEKLNATLNLKHVLQVF